MLATYIKVTANIVEREILLLVPLFTGWFPVSATLKKNEDWNCKFVFSFFGDRKKGN